MEYLTLRNGNKLAFELNINNPDNNSLIILVHGTCGNRNNLFFPALSKIRSFNVLSFDLEGNGDSEGEFLIGGFMREVDNIHEVVLHVQSLGYNVISLIGHSKGGNTILIYSTLYQDIPLLIAIAARFDMSILPKFLDPVMPEVEEKGSSIFFNGKKNFCIDKSGIEERRKLDMNRVLEDTRGKVAVVYGDRDDITSENDAHKIAELLGNKCFRKALVQGSDHFFVNTMPLVVEMVELILNEFVNGPRI
jgi:alpha/beta superfamily hydrolase